MLAKVVFWWQCSRMTKIELPLSILYETEIPTPIQDVIVSLQAVDAITQDAVSLLPSLIDGLQIDQCSLNVRTLEEGSLKEALFLALLVTYQPELSKEVPPMLESLFDVTVSDKYDTIVTVAFLTVLFYGTGLAIDVAKKAFSDSLPRAKFEELVEILALETGKPSSEIRQIVEARFLKPAAAKRVVREAKRFFIPSQKDQNAPVVFDRDRVGSDVVQEVPYPAETDKSQDFDRYQSYNAILLELHAQDRDKSATGWAAVAKEVSEKRLKVRVVDPVQPADLWQKDSVIADVVVVSKLTSEGYTPSEIQITNLIGLTAGDAASKERRDQGKT